MKYKWLNRANYSKIIVFFNGWGMDESIVSHLKFSEYDVLMFYDYNSLETDFDFSVLDKYSGKYLIAWSMGVMCASFFDINYDKKIAINGTLTPIDDKNGIPVRIYDLTLRGFSLEGAQKFINNMFLDEIPKINIKRDFEGQKSELAALKSYVPNLNFKYDKVFISDSDKIIPVKNQENFWRKEANIHSGHAPFFLFKSWGEIL